MRSEGYIPGPRVGYQYFTGATPNQKNLTKALYGRFPERILIPTLSVSDKRQIRLSNAEYESKRLV